jgi:hypothetical protein
MEKIIKGTRAYCSENVYALGENYTTESDDYRFVDEKGAVVWDAKIYRREGLYTRDHEFVDFVHIECLNPRRAFKEDPQKHSTDLIDEAEKFAKENGLKYVEIKFIDRIPDAIIGELLKAHERNNSESSVLGEQFLLVKLKEKAKVKG